MTTRRERVLRALQRAQERGEAVCGRHLGHAQCGGWRYSARVHELRQAGWVIESGTCDCGKCRYWNLQAVSRGDVPPNIHQYRLVGYTGPDVPEPPEPSAPGEQLTLDGAA